MRLLRLRRIKKKEEKGETREGEEVEEEEIEEEKEIEETPLEEMEEVGYSGVFLSQPSEKKEKIKGKEYLVSQFSLSHEEKKLLEREAFGDSGELREKQWEKTARESLEEIEKSIDEGLIEEVVPEEEEEKEEVEVEVLPEGEKVYGRIITREVVYETPGGYVVKVVYREGDDVKTSYYSISKLEGIEHSLDEIKAYKPIIKPTAEETPPAIREEKKEGKTFLDRILGKK